MNPKDARVVDWPMYYGGTWMEHSEFGPGYVEVRDEKLFFKKNREEPLIRVSSKDLSCWWPRSGSYNTPNGAVYIARQAARNMRKSAVQGDHYKLVYGYTHGDTVSLMVNGPDYVDVETALKMMKKNVSTSIAVTRDIILHNSEYGIQVIFRGNNAGVLDTTGFRPHIPADPLAKRAYVKLMQEGVL